MTGADDVRGPATPWTQTLFNGKPKAQKLTAAPYGAKLTTADACYARLLRLLTEAVRRGSAAKGPGA